MILLRPTLSLGFSESDIRKIACLLGQLVTAKGDHTSRRNRLLNGLACLIQADAWTWRLSDIDSTGRKLALCFLQSDLKERSARHHQLLPIISQAKFSDVSALETDTGPRFQNSHLGHALRFETQVPTVGLSTIVFFRHVSLPNFSERDAQIVDLVLSEICWVHTLQNLEYFCAVTRNLSPRLRMILQHLLKGNSRKQIADILGIELNTVHGYVKDIYLVFEVTSHISLLQRLKHDQIPPRFPNEKK
jgi:DNA-binding CsgD family transcriptional regulator